MGVSVAHRPTQRSSGQVHHRKSGLGLEIGGPALHRRAMHGRGACQLEGIEWVGRRTLSMGKPQPPLPLH